VPVGGVGIPIEEVVNITAETGVADKVVRLNWELHALKCRYQGRICHRGRPDLTTGEAAVFHFMLSGWLDYFFVGVRCRRKGTPQCQVKICLLQGLRVKPLKTF